jgi:hypothetical protein
MAIEFLTSQPNSLLAKFDAAVTQAEPKGKITTWEKSDDEIYYTHKAAEWRKKAWLKPTAMTDRLVFNIIRPQNANISSLVYAYYHGHLIETFLNHFDEIFTQGIATALPTREDRCSAT